MSHHALLEYIRRAKDCGADDNQITDRLQLAGWYKVDVEDAIELYHKLTKHSQGAGENVCRDLPIPKPTMAERIVPRSYDPHIIAIAVGVFAVTLVIYLLIK